MEFIVFRVSPHNNPVKNAGKDLKTAKHLNGSPKPMDLFWQNHFYRYDTRFSPFSMLGEHASDESPPQLFHGWTTLREAQCWRA